MTDTDTEEVRPATVVASKVNEVEEELTRLLKDRAECEAELCEHRNKIRLRQAERDALDRQLPVLRKQVAAWRQIQLYVDCYEDNGPGSLLAAALAPGQPQ